VIDMSQNLHPSDAVGRLGACILDAADRIRAQGARVSGDRSDPADAVAHARSVFTRAAKAELERGASDFDRLRTILDQRGSIDLPPRHASYFRGIFPATPVDHAADHGGAPRVAIGGRSLVRLAKELLMLGRLFDEPSQWKENSIFSKEEQYARTLPGTHAFRSTVRDLLQTHGPQTLDEWAYADFRVPDWLEANYDDAADVPAELRFAYDIANACTKFCLLGLRKDAVIPRPFCIYAADNTVRIEVPLYMDMDSNTRSFPFDVVNVLQSRGDPPYELTPAAAARYGDIEKDMDLWLAFAVAAAEDAGLDRTVGVVFDRILGVHAIARLITNKAERDVEPRLWDGYESAVRQVQRRLAKIAERYDAEALLDALQSPVYTARLSAALAASGRRMSGPRPFRSAMLVGEMDVAWLAKQKGAIWDAVRAVKRLLSSEAPSGPHAAT
jgi:hypothetical protein